MEGVEDFSSCFDEDVGIDFKDDFGTDHCATAALEWIEWEEKVHSRYNLFDDCLTSESTAEVSETHSRCYGGILSSDLPAGAMCFLPAHPCLADNFQTNSPMECDQSLTGDCEGSESSEYSLSKKQRFYFDSDILALKQNPNYQRLLRTLALLEAQRMQSIKDIEVLTAVQTKAERDPEAFIQSLKDGTLEPLPARLQVAEIPEINWKVYIDSIQNVLKQSSMFFSTRRQLLKPQQQSGKHKPSGAHANGLKPSSYRQPWSTEEQAKFEELLRIYPPEPIERRRFEKIAKALGTRNTQQVASHVQKYFLKLAKAGLPVPGRIPNLVNYVRNPRRGNKRQFNRPSTFFSALAPRVMMEGGASPSQDGIQQLEDSSDDDNDDDDEDDEDEDDDVDSVISGLLDGQMDDQDDTPPAVVKCVHCGHLLNSGVYWRCLDCHRDTPLVLCHNCIDSDYTDGRHEPGHELEEVVISQTSFLDRDYTQFTQHTTRTSYNYLDPNFHPPV